MLFFLDNLLISQESVSLQCVFHSIRFKVNKGWSKALLLFLCPYVNLLLNNPVFSLQYNAPLIVVLLHPDATRLSNNAHVLPKLHLPL